ncbi:MAG: hypothetical protein IZT55_00190 [Anaerolineae bacterium]|nr:hypothetical protein [Anaerolineae bacterium]
MIIQVLKYIAAIATIVTGLASLFWPTRVLGFTGLDVVGGRGITEVRTILGALFVGLGAAALYFNMPETYQMLGITYLVMAVVRAISIVVDDSMVSSNVISVIAEAVIGIILML